MTHRAALPILICGLIAFAAPAGGQQVNLPYQVPDREGNMWYVHQQAYLQQQGNMPVYGQAGMLQINNANVQSRTQNGKLDPVTGELILENMAAPNGLKLSRRFLFNKDDNYVRVIDIISNPTAKDVTAQLSLVSNSNYGMQSGQVIADPRKKSQNYAFVGLTGNNNRAMVELFNGLGTKNPLTIDYNQGNNQVRATMPLSVPAGKEVAIMHVHMPAASVDAGTEWIKKVKDAQLIKNVPAAIRRILLNFGSSTSWFGDTELLRGDVFDVVELRSGDQFRGTIKADSFKLQTFYGPIELPAQKVLGVLNVGAVRPRQLLVTADADVFGGVIQLEKLPLELSDGQTVEIPMGQISRIGFRKRPGEPDELTQTHPFIRMRSGERIAIKPPTKDIVLHTRYGILNLKPESVAAVVFQNEEHAGHEVHLTEGSRLIGLVDATTMEFALAGSEQVIKFPTSSAARLQLKLEGDEGSPAPDPQSPTLRLNNDELMVGALEGKLRLDTAFTTLSLDAGSIKSLERRPEAPQDLKVTLWDETSFQGMLDDQMLSCKLLSGPTVSVPVSLLQEYLQPLPKPSSGMTEKIKALVAELDADDWQRRQRAQEDLVSIGEAVIPVLKEIRATQPPEAQERIDQVLEAVKKSVK